MTWNDIKTWLLANGWSIHQPVGSVPVNFLLDCEDGKVLSAKSPAGGTVLVHMLERNLRLIHVGSDGKINRLMTANLNMIHMHEGIPRGMGLWTSPASPHSPMRNQHE